MKTKRIKHPVFKDVELDVPTGELAEWLAAGWLEKSQRRKATKKVADTGESESA